MLNHAQRTLLIQGKKQKNASRKKDFKWAIHLKTFQLTKEGKNLSFPRNTPSGLIIGMILNTKNSLIAMAIGWELTKKSISPKQKFNQRAFNEDNEDLAQTLTYE